MKLPILIFAMVSAVAASCGCGGNTPHTTVDAPAHPNDPAQCIDAEKRVCALDCKGRDGGTLCATAGGTRFADVCARATYSWHPAEIALAKTCADVDDAFRGVQ